MLPYEIEPFADHHIAELRDIKTELEEFIAKHPDPDDPITLSRDYTAAVAQSLEAAASALVRFKVCMKDEVTQKDLYRTRWFAAKK